MPIDAGIELAGLSHRPADRAVAVDVVHRHVARVVVGGEQIFAGRVDAGMDRARRKRLRLAMRLQRTRAGIDAEGIGAMRGAGKARSAVARHHVKVSHRRMRPGVLDVGRQNDRCPLLQRGGADIDLEKAQFRADAGIEKALCGHVLTPGIFAAATASANTAVAAQRLITVLGTNRGDETRFHGRISITCWRSNRGSHAS